MTANRWHYVGTSSPKVLKNGDEVTILTFQVIQVLSMVATPVDQFPALALTGQWKSRRTQGLRGSGAQGFRGTYIRRTWVANKIWRIIAKRP